MTKNNDGSDKGLGGDGEGLPTVRICGTMAVHHRLLDTNERYREARERIEEAAFRAEVMQVTQRTGCTEIDVVVHVVHRNASEDLSQAQIDSQIAALNHDFRKRNGDVSGVPAPFSPLAADARITFRLAATDPAGHPTNGVTRTRTTRATGFTDDDAVKSAATGGHDAWPAAHYLNLWACPLSGGLLGYAQFPGGPAATDGVVIRSTAFGTTGTAAAPFNLGRTATHEIGHWLNLRHIWGDDGDGCGGSDFVADTPNQAGPNVGVPSFPHVTCSNGPNGDLFMNYMDYTDDAGMFMFSAGQVTRMQACLDGPRSSIGRSVSCGLTKPFPKEFVKELPKDRPKDGIKESPKDQIKDNPKDLIKDRPKDGIKDNPKEFAKDFPKDRPKEFIKERPKDFIKDRPKEAIFDPQKPPSLENPKLLVEGLGDVFGPVVNPAVNPGVFGTVGVQPFVLGGQVPQAGGFGAGAESGGGRADGAGDDGIANAYGMILAGFAQLAAAGLLDDQGQAVYDQLLQNFGAQGDGS